MALLVAFFLLTLMRSGMSQMNNSNTNRPIGSFCGRNAPMVLSNFFNNRNFALSEIRRQLSGNDVLYARAQSLAEGDSVFGAAQCRNYLSTAQCLACFDAAVSELTSCLTGNGAYVFFDNCFLRFSRMWNKDKWHKD
uniref:putative cysteine-rich repeat secretory protein 7 n=1 Tax=Erigeron canadensis TaxID=72917 RepID=UPI001CB8B7B6|nr:putative cysteine-rich repeat secretory protein 7 [Erigeron canadensis]